MSCTGSTRRAPWPKRPTCPAAALPGRSSRHLAAAGIGRRACSCSSASSRSATPRDAELGRISGGLPFLVKDVLGPRLGVFLLLEVIFAVFVCALAVHAGTVRLMFAMARDNNLPFAHALAHVQSWSKAPIVPSVVVGVLAAAILVVNINLPNVIETLCSVAIVWANLAYLLVTVPLLVARLRRGGDRAFTAAGKELDAHGRQRRQRRRPQRPSTFRWADGDCRSTRSRSSGGCSSSSTSAGPAPRSMAQGAGAALRRSLPRSA